MTHAQVAAVAEQAFQGGVVEPRLAELRARFRGVHLTCCSDDDVINATPYLQAPGLNIYLVDGRDHCLSLTQDLAAATGLLLAAVTDGD